MRRHGVPKLAETFTNPKVMGSSKVTDAAATSKNNAAKTPKFNIRYADNVVEIKNEIANRVDDFGNIIISFDSAIVPKWDEDINTGAPVLVKDDSLSVPISRVIAVLCDKLPGFQGYYDNLKCKRDDDSAVRSSNTLTKVSTDSSNNLAMNIATTLVNNIQQRAARRATNRMYSEIITELSFDGTIIPLMEGETVIYHDGYTKTAEANEIGFDFSLGVSPKLIEDCKPFIVVRATKDETKTWARL